MSDQHRSSPAAKERTAGEPCPNNHAVPDQKPGASQDIAGLDLDDNNLLRAETVPLPRDSKGPAIPDWQNRASFSADEKARFPDRGLRTRYFPTLDVDCPDPTVGARLEQALRALPMLAIGSRWAIRRGRHPNPQGKMALIMRLAAGQEPFPKQMIEFEPADEGDAADPRKRWRLELLAHGQQVKVKGRHPETGGTYTTERWGGGDRMLEISRAGAEKLLARLAGVVEREFAGIWRVRKKAVGLDGGAGGAGGGLGRGRGLTGPRAEVERLVREGLGANTLETYGAEEDAWRVCAMIAGASGKAEWGRELWMEWACGEASEWTDQVEWADWKWRAVKVDLLGFKQLVEFDGGDMGEAARRVRLDKLRAAAGEEDQEAQGPDWFDPEGVPAKIRTLGDLLERAVWIENEERFLDRLDVARRFPSRPNFTSGDLQHLREDPALAIGEKRDGTVIYQNLWDWLRHHPGLLRARRLVDLRGAPEFVGHEYNIWRPVMLGEGPEARWWKAPTREKDLASLAEAHPWLWDWLVWLFENSQEDNWPELVELFLDWMAVVACMPGVKPGFHWLLTSTVQGTGKSSLAGLLGRLAGGMSTVSPKQLGTGFNEWLARGPVIVVEEVKAMVAGLRGVRDAKDLTDELKIYLSGQPEFIDINAKHEKLIRARNDSAWIFTSNHPGGALGLDRDDRRLVVIDTRARAMPRDRVEAWVRAVGDPGEIGRLLGWFAARARSIGDDRARLDRMLGHAVMTAAKAETVAVGEGPLLEWLVREVGTGGLPDVVHLDDVMRALRADPDMKPGGRSGWSKGPVQAALVELTGGSRRVNVPGTDKREKVSLHLVGDAVRARRGVAPEHAGASHETIYQVWQTGVGGPSKGLH